MTARPVSASARNPHTNQTNISAALATTRTLAAYTASVMVVRWRNCQTRLGLLSQAD